MNISQTVDDVAAKLANSDSTEVDLTGVSAADAVSLMTALHDRRFW